MRKLWSKQNWATKNSQPAKISQHVKIGCEIYIYIYMNSVHIDEQCSQRNFTGCENFAGIFVGCENLARKILQAAKFL